MTTSLDRLLDATPVGSASSQRIWWDYASWWEALRGGPYADEVCDALEALEDHWARDCGISRAAVVAVARDNPIRLLVSAMVFGFGSIPYGPSRMTKMLATPKLSDTLANIVNAAHSDAATGFSSLFSNRKTRVPQLNVAMGSKFLYFAAGGLGAAKGSPLVYDLNVYSSLRNLGGGWPDAPNPRRSMTSKGYADYVLFMDGVADRHGRSRDDVEFALFGGRTWLRRQSRLEAIASR